LAVNFGPYGPSSAASSSSSFSSSSSSSSPRNQGGRGGGQGGFGTYGPSDLDQGDVGPYGPSSGSSSSGGGKRAREREGERERGGDKKGKNKAAKGQGQGQGRGRDVDWDGEGEGEGRPLSKEEQAVRDRRTNRFKSSSASVAAGGAGAYGGEDAMPLPATRVHGTCQRLEKEYLRLTAPPSAEDVRPEEVLKRATAQLEERYNAASLPYEGSLGMCSQLKAVRQDLTVQHIVNEFAVSVYELHARVALQEGDMNEYNQCQTQLKHFYAQGLSGCESEFAAYRILYYVSMQGNPKYTGGSLDMGHTMAALLGRPETLSDAAVTHALAVREAARTENFVRFFRLLPDTPNCGKLLLDPMLGPLRLQCLQRMVRAYKPTIPVPFISSALAFTGLEETCIFLLSAGCALVLPAAAGGPGAVDVRIGKAEFRDFYARLLNPNPNPNPNPEVAAPAAADAAGSGKKGRKRSSSSGGGAGAGAGAASYGRMEDWEVVVADTKIDFAGVVDVSADLL